MGSAIIATPVGRLHLTESAAVLSSVSWYKTKRSIGREGWSILPPPASPLGHLRAYFDRRLKTFSLPLAPAATPFQGRVHDTIIPNPHNQTAAYSELARAIDSRPRAVVEGCHTSPFPIVMPCHQVGAANNLGGYSAITGVAANRHLLTHEASSVLESPYPHEEG
jgi:methylated-DNA-[protein]-cysteine S-methyltransferase